jgi:putative nucleotidyltransferase with HDIG domain
MKLTLRKLLHNLSALTDLGAEVGSSHDFDQVIRASLHTLLGTLAIPKGAVTRFTSRPRSLRVIAAKGLPDSVGEKIALEREEADRLLEQARPFFLAEQRNGLARFASRNAPLFKRLRAHAVVPMVVNGGLEGVIFLSPKFTREPYTDDDLEIVNTISRQIAIAFCNRRLVVSLRRKAEENRRLYSDMRKIYHDTVRAFGSAIDLKDAYTKGHSDRVARYAEAIAREMGIHGEELERIGIAAYLHDIGKIVVDRTIINNPRPLTDREFQELNKHVNTGYEILSNIADPWQEIAYMTKCHHEKVDGTGYPQGLRGDQIPLGSKIVTLADSFDAMMTDRPYRVRLTLEVALSDLRRQAGKQFSTEVVVAFCRLLLKEVNGTAAKRVLLPMIGLGFDRTAIAGTLSSMIDELSAACLNGHSLKAAG